MFDRKKILESRRIQQMILNYKFNRNQDDTQKMYTTFANNIIKCLEKTKLLKKINYNGESEKYNKYLVKGCKLLKANDNKSAWKWLKSIIKMNRIAAADSPLTNKKTGQLIFNVNHKAKIIKEHFSKLAEKEPKTFNYVKPKKNVVINSNSI
jgi:hypothetical protein